MENILKKLLKYSWLVLVMILIVSDHGQENGLHTNYGFYSCNKKLDLDNPNISDFKDVIEKMIYKGKKSKK